MARFTYTITGTSPNEVLTINDTDLSAIVAQFPLADLATQVPGQSPWTVPTVTIETVDRPFGTRYGPQREMGLNFHFDFDNSASMVPTSFGQLKLPKFRLGSTIYVENTFQPLGPLNLSPGGPGGSTPSGSRNYPLGNYSPLAVIRGVNYNICAALAYPILDFDHPSSLLYVAYSLSSVIYTDIDFQASLRNLASGPSTVYFDIPAGARRRYTLLLRINDSSTPNVGPATDAAGGWLWTLEGYKRYYRSLYSRPNYRRMNGLDGRPMASFNTSAVFSDPTGNPRGFSPANPTTTGGTPAGYYKFSAEAVLDKGRNVPRHTIWALSGHHNDSAQYDFRFATQVSTNVGDAAATIRGALRSIRGNMKLGLWWGQSTTVFPNGDFFVTNDRYEFDPDAPADVAAAFAESDLAVHDWQAQFVGLDQYDLLQRSPRKAWDWFKTLQRRYPRVVFSPEAAAPDFMHTLGPTYLTIVSVATLRPFWIQHYLNPGAELLLQINVYDVGASEDSATIAAAGMAGLTDWDDELPAGLIASPRWRELGEHAIPYSRFGVSNAVSSLGYYRS